MHRDADPMTPSPARCVILAALLTVTACGDSGRDDPATDAADSADAPVIPDDSSNTEVTDVPPPSGGLVINEVAPAGLGGSEDPANPGTPPDWLEIANPTGAPVSLDGWQLTDSDPTHVFTFPAGSVIAAGGWRVVAEGTGGLDFGLGASDGVRLLAPDGTVVDTVDWTADSLPRNANLGRLPDMTGAFQAVFVGTPGSANQPNPETTCGDGVVEGAERCETGVEPAIGCEDRGFGGGSPACGADCAALDYASCNARAAGLVINELTSTGDDRVELLNGGEAEAALGGLTLTDAGGGTFTFADGEVLAPGARRVLVRDVDHTFGLGDSDGLTLASADGTVLDRVRWGSGEAVVSLCRRPDGVGGFASCPSASFGDPNF